MGLFDRKNIRENSSPTLLMIFEYKNGKSIRSIKLADKGVKINYWNCSTSYKSYKDFINDVYDYQLQKSKA